MQPHRLVLTVALCSFATVAHADYVRFTSTGTLQSGADNANFFGLGPSLSGQAYTFDEILDLSVPSLYVGTGEVDGSGQPVNFDYFGGPDRGYPISLTGALTIGGRSYKFSADSSDYGSYFPSRPYLYATDNSFGGHIFNLDFNYLDFGFDIYDRGPFRSIAYGTFSPDTLDFARHAGNAPSLAPVPEPATWMLLIAGFGMTGAALRRRLGVRSIAFGSVERERARKGIVRG